MNTSIFELHIYCTFFLQDNDITYKHTLIHTYIHIIQNLVAASVSSIVDLSYLISLRYTYIVHTYKQTYMHINIDIYVCY